MTSEAKKIAKLRLLKKVGLIGLITTGAIGLVFLVLSLLPQGNAAFSIRIDNPELTENSEFKIFSSQESAESGSNKDSVTYLEGKPLSHAGQTDAKVVEEHLKSVTEFNGNNNLTNDSGYDLAMVYTIYLTNTTQEEIHVKYAVRLDAFSESSETMASPIEYFRVLVQTQESGNAESLSNVYYGQKRSNKYPNYKYDSEDGREPIFTHTYGQDDGVHVESSYQSQGNDGYCLNFDDYRVTKDIVVSEVVVPVGKVIRYTFVAFFDGEDIDSYVRTLNNDYLLLSLHFGV